MPVRISDVGLIANELEERLTSDMSLQMASNVLERGVADSYMIKRLDFLKHVDFEKVMDFTDGTLQRGIEKGNGVTKVWHALYANSKEYALYLYSHIVE